FEGHQGFALTAAFDDLPGAPERSGLMVQLGDYPEVFQTAFADRIVRRPESAGTHLRIYGQLEARLTQSDRVILGGLVEGVWPPAPRNDPWLSRPMRHELGLDLPERRIGRPKRLSVTAIEDWLRDPYTIYAKHILKLEPLDPVDMPLSAADRGSAIHDALGDFTQEYKTALPDDAAGVLRRIGERHFAPL